MSTIYKALILIVVILCAASAGRAEPLIPGPGVPGFEPALAQKDLQFARQFFEFNARNFGVSLDVFIPNEANRQLLYQWIETDHDFISFSQQHPYELISHFDEWGDLGMFGGMATAGDAWRYIVLRDGGAPLAEVEEARQVLLRALDAWHIYVAVTGEPGAFARGIRLRVPQEAGAPPIPGTLPETLPLFDAQGDPQPADKAPTWRDDQTGLFPDWIWLDDTSKDQADGYFLVMGALWDAIANDADIPQSYRDRMVSDALALANRLMTVHSVGGVMTPDVYMVLIDADGRPVTHYGLNPQVIDESNNIVVAPDFALQNGFNGLLGLGAMKVLHHITGDPTIGAFYYEELIDTWHWDDSALNPSLGGVSSMYLGSETNFSNVNMAAVAFYNILRYEGDPDIRGRFAIGVEEQFYNPGKDRQAKGLKLPFFDLLYTAFRHTGTDAQALADAMESLRDWHEPPYFDIHMENCDSSEIASGNCTGLDGTPIELESPGSDVPVDPVPIRIRPPSNFENRSNPYTVNGGGGGDRLDPGGCFRSSYWLGRLLVSSSSSWENMSPFARDRSNEMVHQPDEDGGTSDADGGTGPDGGDPAAGDSADAYDAGSGDGFDGSGDPGEDAGGDAGTGDAPGGEDGAQGDVDRPDDDEVDGDDGCGCSTPPSHYGSMLIVVYLVPLLLRRRSKRTEV